jgi:pyridoxine 5-phosphate synthase
MSKSGLRLGVNIDHVATIRNARGGGVPDPVRAAKLAIAAGADGITAHLREDRRHIRDDDMRRLKAEIEAPLNFEMAATDEMVAIALATRPHACCLVPEKRSERTTEGGLDVVGELHTGAWCDAIVHDERDRAAHEFERIRLAAQAAESQGIECHAGHGLDFETARVISALPQIVELNIGHFLIGEAIFFGLEATIAAMRASMKAGRAGLLLDDGAGRGA